MHSALPDWIEHAGLDSNGRGFPTTTTNPSLRFTRALPYCFRWCFQALIAAPLGVEWANTDTYIEPLLMICYTGLSDELTAALLASYLVAFRGGLVCRLIRNKVSQKCLTRTRKRKRRAKARRIPTYTYVYNINSTQLKSRLMNRRVIAFKSSRR